MTSFVPAVVEGAAAPMWTVAQAAATVITHAVVAVVMVWSLHGGAVAQAAETGGLYAATGTVVAVTPESNTLVIQSTLKDDTTWIVGALVTDQTTFAGRAKALQDVRPGDRVNLEWVREEGGDIARSILLK